MNCFFVGVVFESGGYWLLHVFIKRYADVKS